MLENISGFIYYVSVTGITGQKSAVAERVAPEVARIKRYTRLPVAVGFGIREPHQAAEIARIADAAVVGSALIDLLAGHLDAQGLAGPGLVARGPSPRSGRWPGRPGGSPMSWLTDYVRPKIRALYTREKSELPENLWQQCASCERMIFHRDLEANQRVCPHCDHHMRVGPDYRFAGLFDEGSWQKIEMPKSPPDPLRFRDQKKYVDRLREAQAKTKAGDALDAALGRIGGLSAVIAVMNFEFMGGSMGTSLGEGFVVAARHAVRNDAAFIVVTSSGGARMQEGALSLMQMARTTVAVEEVKEAGLPYIVVLTDPTTGGVTASFAMIGDVHLAEPGAMIGFAGAQSDRADDPREAARRLPARRISAGARHGRPGRAPLRAPGDPGSDPRSAAAPGSGDRGASHPRGAAGTGHGRRGRLCRSRRRTWAMASCASDLILARLHALHPKSIDLSLGRVERLLAALGNPERRLAPVIHVAGTNGKGSTLAMLAAMLQGRPAGAPLHLAPSGPVQRAYPDRWRADRRRRIWPLVSSAARRANAGAPITFFEITTAAAFLAFAERPRTGCCWRPDWAAGWTRPTSSSDRACA